MTPDQLTLALRRAGHLDSARVTEVTLSPFETAGIASDFFKATICYSPADPTLPASLVVKQPRLSDRGRGEADVYESIFAGTSGLPLLGFFGAVDEAPDKPLSLLFEDLSGTHRQTTWPIIPTLADCQRSVTALATVHGHWWGRTGSLPPLTPPVAAHQATARLAAAFPAFADDVGEYLPPSRVRLYERVFGHLDDVLQVRLAEGDATLLHTDPHFWNFLYAKDPTRDRCVIFDWPLWRTGIAGCDLAYQIALHLYPEHRRRFEPVLLERYREALAAAGVHRTEAAIHHDYRLGIVVGLLMPVMEHSWKIPPLDWMPKLEKALSAFDEWGCEGLLPLD